MKYVHTNIVAKDWRTLSQFYVEDVADVYNKALAHGASALGEITPKEVEGVGLLTFVYFRDLEGNIIEIQSWN